MAARRLSKPNMTPKSKKRSAKSMRKAAKAGCKVPQAALEVAATGVLGIDVMLLAVQLHQHEKVGNGHSGLQLLQVSGLEVMSQPTMHPN